MTAGRARRSRRGNAVILVALSCVTLIAFAAVTIDLGYARLVHLQLEHTSEAAAHAGSMRLDGTTAGMAAARATALALAAANPAAGEALALDANEGNDPSGDVVLGTWDDDADAFTPSDDPALVDTVQVRARIPSLGLFVAPVGLGIDTTPVSAMARAVALRGGAGEVDCYLPLAMASCLVDRYTVPGLEDVTLKLSPAGIDNVGWGRANGSPDANWSREQILECQGDAPATIGDPVGLQNGATSSVLSAIAAAIADSSTTWRRDLWGVQPPRARGSGVPASRYGRTLEGPILVFEGGPSYCTGSGGAYNQDEPLVGFVWAAIYDVVPTGANKNLRLRLDTSTTFEVGTGSGGPDYGVVADLPPRLVQTD